MMGQNGKFEDEGSAVSQPRSLEQALADQDTGSIDNESEPKSEKFEIDENRLFKLEGASLTITSK
jgi:hypothetical protein